MPKPTQTNYFVYKMHASSCGVSQDVLAISFHNDWKGDILASFQNRDSQFWYGESWYGFVP